MALTYRSVGGPRSPVSKRTRLTADERRATIVAAAIELMAEQGYDAVSVGAIAEAAGCSKPVLYDHFPSKAALAIAVVEQTGTALMDQVTRAVLAVAGASSETQLRTGLDAFFGFAEQRSQACRVVFRDPGGEPTVCEAQRRTHRRATEGVAALFASALGDDAPPPLRLELYAHITTSALAHLLTWRDEHPDVPREELVAAMMDYAFLGLERVAAGESLAQE